ncbi:hypothetical protein CPB83DRAFT_860553 [Crepidotus variabilis]|uniref:Uncharacterized protein n=1 Tax=Crepidotus variabilis TaxID=179855 RepID=A0A9P6E9C3_9AGAR|nr:hypothetical protein CPB83DRAFT_860553 [Crepidotus variabilis]
MNLQLPFAPENLHYGTPTDGQKPRLIITGHPDVIGLTKVIANMEGGSGQSWVTADSQYNEASRFKLTDSTVNLNGWKLEMLLPSDGLADGGRFGTSTGVVDPDRETLYIAGLCYEGRIMMCPRQPSLRT